MTLETPRYSFHVVNQTASVPNRKRVGVLCVNHDRLPVDFVPKNICEMHGVTIITTWELLPIGNPEFEALCKAEEMCQKLRGWEENGLDFLFR